MPQSAPVSPPTLRCPAWRWACIWPLAWLLSLGGCALSDSAPDRAALIRAAPASGEAVYLSALDFNSPADPFLAERLAEVSRLALMKDQPADLATLSQRLAVSLTEAESLLNNQGYYEGRVTGRLEKPSGGQVPVVVIFDPEPRYKIGRARVFTAGQIPSGILSPPLSLAEAGLAEGGPARADDMLKAVEGLAEAWRDQGFPEARVQSARYVLNRAARELEAEITLDPGPFVRLGPVLVSGESPVGQGYLEALKTWRDGQPWSQALVEDYLDILRRTGLFQSVELAAGPAAPDQPAADERELRPVQLALTAGPARTVGGQINYDTDFGPGVKLYWEHRNLFGQGDRFRLDLPVWADLKELTGTYRYPFIFRPDQDFIARGGFLNQNTEAYRLWSGSAEAGFERRLSRYWRASLTGYLEGGALEDPGRPQESFQIMGLPAAVNYDRTDDLINSTRGARLNLTIAPYSGEYHDRFQVWRTRLEGQTFLPLGTPRAVLALRGLWGGLWGLDDSRDVPSSLRFYSGGGGSVRGYDYQSVGPRNDQNRPLGGLSQVEAGAEARLRFTESLGAVAFLDGGMVHAQATDAIFQDLMWGAGAGLRYFTPIGPVRLDAAVPLDRRPGDSSWQLYISLGQSF